MSDHCDDHDHMISYRPILWTVFFINAGMFLFEASAGQLAGSVSLQADALDFFADAANYLIALFVLAKSIQWRSGTAMLKGVAMGVFGFYVLGFSLYQALSDAVPVAPVMGAVGTLALIANVVSAFLLYRYRDGDSNMRAVWLCSRNDAIANVAVIGAAGLVYMTAAGWPDLAVGFFMAAISLHSAWQIIRHAQGELSMAGTAAE